jgi:hypothetical protein
VPLVGGWRDLLLHTLLLNLAIVLSIIVLSLVPYYFAQISCAEEWEPFMGFI